jgi:hypothetical protein
MNDPAIRSYNRVNHQDTVQTEYVVAVWNRIIYQ